MKWFKSISLEIFNPFHFPSLQPTFVGITNCLLLHKSKFGCLISFYCIDLCWVSCMAAPNHRLFPLTRKDLWLMNLNVRESQFYKILFAQRWISSTQYSQFLLALRCSGDSIEELKAAKEKGGLKQINFFFFPL